MCLFVVSLHLETTAGVFCPVLPGLRSISFLSGQEGNWTPGPGRRTGLDTPAIQSSIKVKETLKLRGNVYKGFVRDETSERRDEYMRAGW